MADDGLLLNFDVSNVTLTPAQRVKGGTWRARRREQKRDLAVRARSAQQEHGLTRQEAEETKIGNIRKTDNQKAKRQRLNGEFRPASQNTLQPNEPSIPTKRRTTEFAQKGPKQIISSLFTYNPVSRLENEEKEEESNQDVEPSNAPLTKEQLNFTTLGLSPTIATHLTQKLGVTAPTAIQKSAIPQLLEDDSDAFIQAETGSGKTLAYLLPILQRLIEISHQLKQANKEPLHRDSGLFAIILAPTRELSKQITVVLDGLLRCTPWIVSSSVIGGEKKKSEKARLRKGVNILVATPGRLVDHLDHTEVLDVSNVRWLVLDEGDRLMELGFEEDIKSITTKLDNRMKMSNKEPIEGLPVKRINILCSATIKNDVQRLGDISLSAAKDIRNNRDDEGIATDEQPIQGTEATFSAPAQLKQSYTVVPAKLRLVTLLSLLKRTFRRKDAVKKTIVFLSCADSVDFHFEVFTRPKSEVTDDGNESDANSEANDIPSVKDTKRRDIASSQPQLSPIEPTTSGHSALISSTQQVTAFRLHGSLPQKTRTKTIQSFADTKEPAFLLCTDVASRGLDLPNVDFVIEYDPAFSRDEHLHRIGRTARAGRDGRSTIFLMPGCEEGYARVLREGQRPTGASIPGHSADELLRKGLSDTKDKTVKEAEAGWQQRATDAQLGVERWVLASPRAMEMARRAFQSHVRAYATHVSAERQFFDIKQLHLGHLAKAFGLRDAPGKINVPGLKARAGKVKSDRAKAGAKQSAERRGNRGDDFGLKRKAVGLDLPEQNDMDEARRKMRSRVKMMEKTSAGEFNLA